MSTIDDLETKKRKYQILKQNLNLVSGKLRLAINEAKDLKTAIKNNYVVNDSNAPVGVRTNNLVTNMTETYKKINNIIIPAIDAKLNDVDKDITEEKQKEETSS